ncbi:hypothetical protein FSP39_016973 [Pinctada imbricata]|uniref:Uncharacterized protein n=1 Tax=Pinctada imbricata TaxID=66713 RepID=A0AA88XSV0_PINIB|nr:hypothetical protein FSP39_016973 [Pinctada imbricata]
MQSLTPKTASRPLHATPRKSTPMRALQAFDPLLEASTSVPNLATNLDVPYDRQRSASFGSRGGAEIKPRPLGQGDPRLAHLNASWNTLQQQLGAKEQELHAALQKQERYQQSVQDVTSRMEKVNSRLSRGFPATFNNLDQQLKDYKETLQDIDGIREDIARVRERGRQVVESSDPEGYRAMQATIAMLTDRVDNLQAMADDKGRQLQKAVKDRERHDIALTAHKRQVKDLENWLEEQRIRQAATPLPSDSVGELKKSLQENQDEINKRLQTMSDLAVQCDALCEVELPRNADKLRNQLTNLQTNMGNLKLAAIEKQAPLRAAIKESEKRQREMDDYETSVKKLQNWVTETKQMTLAPPSVESMIVPDDHMDLQQKLKSDLFDHRQLIRQLSGSAATRDVRLQRDVTEELPALSEAELKERWETLSREMALRKHNLEDMLYGRDSVDSGPRGWIPSSEVSGQLKDVRQNLLELR